MEIGLVGLGKMGLALAQNLVRKGHRIVAYDKSPQRREEIVALGIMWSKTLADMVASLAPPRRVWLMVPAGVAVEETVTELATLVTRGDIITDAGNSFYKDSLARHEWLGKYGIHFVDAGVSGGIEGAREGCCLMVGGEPAAISAMEPLFLDLAVDGGLIKIARPGAGHFLKMIHNGIEYGMMQALGEGFEILAKSPYQYPLHEVAQVWNHGSVIRGWLMELLAQAFVNDPDLQSIKGVMNSSGEGRWTVEAALELQAVAPTIALSQMMRYRSLQEETMGGKVVAALRHQFGGHAMTNNETQGK